MDAREKILQELQNSLLPELENILVSEPISNFRKTNHNTRLSTRKKPIFDVSEKRKTIYNLDSTTPKYEAFLNFMLTEFKKINRDFKNNTGDVLSFHCFDEQYRDELAQITQTYRKNFIDELDIDKAKSTTQHYTTKEGQIYPNFLEDLLYKTRYMQYEKVEKKLGIKNIQEQSDKEFIETIKKRIEGLEKCSKSDETNLDRKEYYETEYQREKTKLEELLKLQKKNT